MGASPGRVGGGWWVCSKPDRAGPDRIVLHQADLIVEDDGSGDKCEDDGNTANNDADDCSHHQAWRL